MREIITFDSYEDSSKKYVDDLKYIIARDIKFVDKPPVLMLSGGVDSMLLGCILKEYFGLKDSITVGCVKDTDDVKVSQDTAQKLGINNNLVLTT
jgi:asparagine synthetase B (glutamine-hydrolysing)